MSNPTEILTEFREFYKKLYQKRDIDREILTRMLDRVELTPNLLTENKINKLLSRQEIKKSHP